MHSLDKSWWAHLQPFDQLLFGLSALPSSDGEKLTGLQGLHRKDNECGREETTS